MRPCVCSCRWSSRGRKCTRSSDRIRKRKSSSASPRRPTYCSLGRPTGLKSFTVGDPSAEVGCRLRRFVANQERCEILARFRIVEQVSEERFKPHCVRVASIQGGVVAAIELRHATEHRDRGTKE